MLVDDFKSPRSLQEAYDRRRILVAEIQEIDTQLGNPLKKDEYENRADFYAWRQGAKWARTRRLEELRLVKDWIRETNAA